MKLREANKLVWDHTANHKTQAGFGFPGSKFDHKIKISRQFFTNP